MNRTSGTYKKNLGVRGQQIGVQWLQNQGFEILLENYRPTRAFSGAGEIDVVCSKHGEIHFVEVKYHFEFLGQNLISTRQRARLWQSAKVYRAEYQLRASQNIRIWLLWINCSNGHIEFLENP
jgi:Holliday junction resolvase-like predicted endonuclease